MGQRIFAPATGQRTVLFFAVDRLTLDGVAEQVR
jgi:hypothetical protein